MTVRLGINGFGRMGRLGLRVAWSKSDLDIVRINEPACDAACSAHLLKFDSVHGMWNTHCDASDNAIIIDDKSIEYYRNHTPGETDWSGCDLIIEASGRFRKMEQLQSYLDQGVRKIIVAAPVEGALNIVYGINDHLYDHTKDHIATAASCTTNCLAPIVKVMHDKIGILHGSMTTLHNITNTQTIVDKGHKDLRRARACGQSLIPTTTGSAKAITQIFPELAGKLDGLAIRVPLLNASLTDFVFETARTVTKEEVNGYFNMAASAELKGILGYEERPLVSIDFKDDPRSAIVDALSTMVIHGTQVKVLAWYDNEWGYVNRMMELASKIARHM